MICDYQHVVIGPHVYLFTPGKGTSHCTNGIVIQRKPLTCALPPDIAAEKPRSKNRSLTCISAELLPFHSGTRQGPSPFNMSVREIIELDPQTGAYARAIDFGWMLCRQPIQDSLFAFASDRSQVMSAWTGFNIRLQKEHIPRESSIGCCQVIDASPTEMPTVYTLLHKSLQMANQLDQRT